MVTCIITAQNQHTQPDEAPVLLYLLLRAQRRMSDERPASRGHCLALFSTAAVECCLSASGLRLAFPSSPPGATKPQGVWGLAVKWIPGREEGVWGEGNDEWQQVCRQMGRREPRRVPVEVQAAGFSTEPPSLASALWGEAGKVLRRQARGEMRWSGEKFNQPDESLSVHVKQEREGGKVWKVKEWQEVTGGRRTG